MFIDVKKVIKHIRSVGSWWIAEKTLNHLQSIRIYELDIVLALLPSRGDILEIGAGTGWQANILEGRGYRVYAIDLPSSKYRDNRVRPITEYDGRDIPYRDDCFDVVFSSNVLEHIPHIHEFQREILRVLKPGGLAVHVVPSSSWRLWTNMTHLLKYWTRPNIHGTHAGNSLTEVYYFSRRWWARLFRETGWIVVTQTSNGLFYTGCSIMDVRLPIKIRKQMHYLLGSSCNIFLLRKANQSCNSDEWQRCRC